MIIHMNPSYKKSQETEAAETVLGFNVEKIPVITTEEELELIASIKEGSVDAVEKLCYHNLRYVAAIAKQYSDRGLSMDELVEAGQEGLIEAAKKYDETQNYRFFSFASWRIRSSILEALANQERENAQRLFSALSKREQFVLQQSYEKGWGSKTQQEVADQLNISVERACQIRAKALRWMNRNKTPNKPAN